MPLPSLRRKSIWDPPTLLDSFITSPLSLLIRTLYIVLLFLRGASFAPPRNKPRIRIVCISDSHSHTVPVPDGDLLIHAGDLTNSGKAADIQIQLDWLASLPHKYKIFIAGNHDGYFDVRSRTVEDKTSKVKLNLHNLHYLQKSSVQLKFKGGRTLNFYGAPDIPRCGGDDNAFQYDSEQAPWSNRIPLSTDVLITHTPPRNHLDISLGCPSLLKEIWRVKPRLHVFGHVHSGHGRETVFWDEGQAAYERILGREKTGILVDCIPSTAWLDALRVLWYGIKGILWQHLMVGQKGGNGGLQINAALTYQSTSRIGNRPEVVEL